LVFVESFIGIFYLCLLSNIWGSRLSLFRMDFLLVIFDFDFVGLYKDDVFRFLLCKYCN
jgi:hypothetical protein